MQLIPLDLVTNIQSVQDKKQDIKLAVVKTNNWSINNKTGLGPFGPSSSGRHV